jgi:hypothetical protein
MIDRFVSPPDKDLYVLEDLMDGLPDANGFSAAVVAVDSAESTVRARLTPRASRFAFE